MLRSIARRIAEGAGMAARPRSNAGDTAQSVPMSTNTPTGDKPTDRDAPTRDFPVIDDRPQLIAHDVSDVADGPLIAFYDPDGSTMDGEIMYARATVKERDWL